MFKHAQITVPAVSSLVGLMMLAATPAEAAPGSVDLVGLLNSVARLIGVLPPDSKQGSLPATDQTLGKPAPIASPKSPKQAILDAFGPKDGPRAIRVSKCESKLDVNAKQGRYVGLFQMGAWERRKFGHGPDAESQALAAFRYYRAAGWGPWSRSQKCWKT